MPGGITVVAVKCPKCIYYNNGTCRLFHRNRVAGITTHYIAKNLFVEHCVANENLCGSKYKFFEDEWKARESQCLSPIKKK